MKFWLRVAIAFRVLTHSDAIISNNYCGRLNYYIGLAGSKYRRSLEIVIRTDKYIKDGKHE